LGASDAVASPDDRDATAPMEWPPRERLLKELVASVPVILKSQNPQTGRFGNEPWICQDQNVLFPLAAAWAIDDKTNPYHHDQKLLEAIMKGGDALIADQDVNGMWIFRKKDNSTWGQILMPWTYSRWIRAFYLVKDAMPSDRREHWEKGLRLGFENVSKRCLGRVHNIPTHHAMALYCAGECLGRDDWKQQARAFMAKVVAAQSAGGWWSEHSGPVVGYNTVYVEALGVYYSMSRDETVLEALRRSARFHATLTYPDGSSVETVDERNPYHGGIEQGNVGLTFSPEGRGYLLRQQELAHWSVPADDAASFLLYGDTGPASLTAAENAEGLTIIGDHEALILRRRPWFICLSAFICESTSNRWIQDRQNFASVFHDRVGLILGGGNTKLQPYWSNFSVGDTSLLQHVPGDEDPDFRPKGDLIHVPSAARLQSDRSAPALEFTYGTEQCRLSVSPRDDTVLSVRCEAGCQSGKPVEGHLTFWPRVGSLITCASGKQTELGSAAFEWSAGEMGAWFEHNGVRVGVPAGARLCWPKQRHNPYTKDGHSDLSDARLVLCLPFSPTLACHEVTLEVGK
jgi:hypothetical protein